MDQSSPDNGVVLRTRQRDECRELRLVLDAAGIASSTEHQRGWWLLIVDIDDINDAETELDEYRRENSSRSQNLAQVSRRYRGAGMGVLVYAVVILSVSLATLPWGLGLDLFTPGQTQSARVTSGEWWRTVTALTLHVDEGHVASNLLFGVLFGFLAGRTLGGGVAWLSIVLAGALGNFFNAFVQPPEHTSVGASTAVFAALGILVADALRPRSSSRESLLRRWRPLVGGIMLLALIGVGGGRVDVIAHVTGFLSGLLIGWASSRLPARMLANDAIQLAAGTIAIAIVLIAWTVALSGAG